MTAEVNYVVRKQGDVNSPTTAPRWEWVLLRTGTLTSASGEVLGLVPEVQVAEFTSEREADLFEQWLDSLKQARNRDTARERNASR